MAIKSLSELQDIAYKIATQPKPPKSVASKLPTYFDDGSEAMLFKHWKGNKHIGTPYGPEYDVVEGGYALITSLGIVVYWDGVNDVQEL